MRFFVRKEQIENERITVTGEDAHHIHNVLRMRRGEKLTVCDFFGNEYACVIEESDGKRVALGVLSKKLCESEPPFPVSLLTALPKGDKMDLVVQKSVELGVYEIQPFFSAFTVVKPDENSDAKKTERRKKIAEAAAKQCGRGRIPEVHAPLPFLQALKAFDGKDGNYLKIFCYEGEEELTLKEVLQSAPAPSGIAFVVGSEGGFSSEEAEEARALGFRTVTLGKRILRCETAPLAVLSQIAYEYDF